MKNYDKITWLILFVLFPFVFLYSQTEQYRFEHLNTKDGFTSSGVFDILKDSKGFIWFATIEGLYRYDGYNFKVYFNKFDDPETLSENVIWKLFEDNLGRLWVGTFARGINKYNRYNDSFKRYLPNPDSVNMGANGILSIYQDNSGVIWTATTKGGLHKYIDSLDTFTTYLYDTENPDNKKNIINNIYEDKFGNFWIGSEMGLYLFERENKLFKIPDIFDSLQIVLRIGNENVNNSYLQKISIMNTGFFNKTIEDHNGNLWFGTFYGLVKYNHGDKGIIVYPFYKGKNNSLENWIIRDMVEDPDEDYQIYWILASSGLYKFNKITGQVEEFIYDPNNESSISYNLFKGLYLDNHGLLWIGSETSGVNKLNTRLSSFEQVQIGSQKHCATSFCEDRLGNIWIGTEKGGIFKYNPKLELIDNYLTGLCDQYDICKYFYTLYEDDFGNIWAGGIQSGLYLFDAKNNIFKPCYFNNEDGDIILGRINEFYQDSFGWYWTGGSERTKGLIYKPADSISNNLFFEWKQEPLSNARIRDFAEDNKGNLYLAVQEDGVYILTPQNREKMKFLKFIPDTSNIKILNNCFAICMDTLNNIFFGVSKGIIMVSLTEYSIKKFDSESGLNTSYVLDIQIDNNGLFWLATTEGLIRFDPYAQEDKRSKIIGFHDGAPFEEIYPYKIYKDKSGRIYAGGKGGSENGFYRFNPSNLKENTNIPPIVITEFKIKNQSHKLDSNISFVKNIELKHNQNFFSFQFAALDYTNPEKNQYAYFLEGFDEDWIYSETRRFANYTGVPPGDYIFRVKGSNNDGYWNEKGTYVAITILPPPWKTWWAYTLYGIFILGVIYSIIRYYLKRQQLLHKLELEHYQSEKLAELDKMKSHFFANISHEFRTPLTLILGPLEKLRSKMKDRESEKDLNMMQRNARRLQNLINQLLSLSKIESGQMKLQASEENIVSMVNGYVQSFESLAKQKKIDLKFHSDKDHIPVFIDRDKLEKILYNLLSNAFKFTDAGGRIQVTVGSLQSKVGNQQSTSGKTIIDWGLKTEDSNGSWVCLKIEDTGHGIPQDKLKHIFDRFYQADDSYTKGQEGSGIGLALTKELVELHHGTIIAESQVGKGTTFRIHLPLGKDHLKPEEILVFEKPGKEIERPEIVFTEQDIPKAVVEEETEESDGKPLLLVVEDNDDLRSYIRSYLMEEYLIAEAIDGEMGLQKATEKIPDLIISDVMMPKMDGMELCKSLKTDERTSHIPVILLTAKAAMEDRIEGLETGADDFITKPFDPQELLVRIKNLIQQRLKLQKIFSGNITSISKFSDSSITSMDKKFMEKVIGIVEKNLPNADFSVENFSQEMNMSRMQLHRKLKALVNLSANEFIRTIRLNRAALLLKEKTGNIAEIAYDVGFNNPSYFSECFRKQFGKLPSEYVD